MTLDQLVQLPILIVILLLLNIICQFMFTQKALNRHLYCFQYFKLCRISLLKTMLSFFQKCQHYFTCLLPVCEGLGSSHTHQHLDSSLLTPLLEYHRTCHSSFNFHFANKRWCCLYFHMPF